MVGMLSGIALVRLLGVEQFGIFAFALSISAVLVSINDLGQVVAIINYRGPDLHRAARTAATLAVCMSRALYVALLPGRAVAGAASSEAVRAPAWCG